MQVAVTNSRLVQNTNHEDDENYFVSLYGSERVAEQKISPTSANINGGTTTFSFQPPSTGTIMDKCVLLEVEVELEFDVDSAVASFPAPKAWPINSAIQTLQVTINGRTITSAPNQLKSFMERLHTSKELRRRFSSFTPTFRDNDLDYDDMAEGREGYNPFARRQIMSQELSRAQWPNEQTLAYTAGAAGPPIVPRVNQRNKWTFCEPLFIDVFETTKVEGIHNINKIDITINWMPDLYIAMFGDARVITAATTAANPATVAAANSVAGGNVNKVYGLPAIFPVRGRFVANAQNLLVRYVKPSSVPKNLLTLPYIEYTRYNKITDAVAHNAQKEIVFDAIRETMVPRYGILVVKRREAANHAFLADTMFRIDSINIQVDNMQGLLSTASPKQLWQMSTRNGLDVSWNEWYNQGQCIVVFEFGEDIGGLIPNVVGQFNMLVTIKVTNQFGFSYTPEAELFLSKDGFLEITPNEMQIKLGIMYGDVELAVQNENIQATEENDEVVGEAMQGAGFKKGFKKFRKFANSALRGAETGVNVASKLAGLAMAGRTLMGAGKLMN